jgi:hypothetical protein
MIFLSKPNQSVLITPDRDFKGTPATENNIENSEWRKVEQVLTRSLEEHVKIRLTVNKPHGTSDLKGFVTVVNTYLREIKLREEDDWQWIRFEDIRSAQI